MKVIPVLDLMAGQVVRGIAGRRHEYRPIVSRLCDSSDPLAIARAFRDHLGVAELYLADLDALAGNPPCWNVYAGLRSEGFQLWVDAGIRHAEDAVALVSARVDRVVVGLETVAGPAALEAICQTHGHRIVFSLDLKEGQPLAVANAWEEIEPFAIASQAIGLGVTSILVLDLRRVGTGTGTGTEDLCRRVSASFPLVQLAAGGGIRGVADLRRLQDSGVHAALVASALHDGVIKPGDWPST